MKHLTLTLAILFCLSLPCSAVTMFTADYDGDNWTETVMNYGEEIPLREVSQFLPFTVGWDDNARCVTVEAYGGRVWRYFPDWWLPEGITIRGGAPSNHTTCAQIGHRKERKA